MADNRFVGMTWAFWLIFAIWLASAVPIALFSVLTLELLFWPSFSAESTAEGILIWTIFAAWFYLTPVVLLAIRRRKRVAVSKPNRLKAD